MMRIVCEACRHRHEDAEDYNLYRIRKLSKQNALIKKANHTMFWGFDNGK